MGGGVDRGGGVSEERGGAKLTSAEATVETVPCGVGSGWSAGDRRRPAVAEETSVQPPPLAGEWVKLGTEASRGSRGAQEEAWNPRSGTRGGQDLCHQPRIHLSFYLKHITH